MRESKLVLHFYYKCSRVNGTILLVVQQRYMYKGNRSLRLYYELAVSQISSFLKSHNKASVAKSDRWSLVFLAYRVGAVLVLYLSSYSPLKPDSWHYKCIAIEFSRVPQTECVVLLLK